MNKVERREYQRKYREKNKLKVEKKKRLKQLDKKTKLSIYAEIDGNILELLKSNKKKRINSMSKARRKRRIKLQNAIKVELEAEI
ncbi:hypothetical protein [Macrococcoides bohemicum]|uniref:hypothetical protein n=1 Tax=Macrococcoides bohemicum TaxID=1903056 RepID=UPI00165D8395|nr:hypothetical protein [Macrococcus bohemicus]MBC9873329.1 hypothetical protein [Macrococcus bohemicus]